MFQRATALLPDPACPVGHEHVRLLPDDHVCGRHCHLLQNTVIMEAMVLLCGASVCGWFP